MSKEEEINQENNQEDKEDFSKEKHILRGLFIVGVILTVYFKGVNYYMEEERLEIITKNTQYFKKNITLRCSGSFIGNAKYYLISNNTGWAIYDTDYFKKEELLLNIQYCKKEK